LVGRPESEAGSRETEENSAQNEFELQDILKNFNIQIARQKAILK
jgi:hypothetical protein